MKKSFWLTSVKLVWLCKVCESQKAWDMAFEMNAHDRTVVDPGVSIHYNIVMLML